MLNLSQNNEKKVSEKTLFVGLDVHHRKWAVSIHGAEKIYRSGISFVPDPHELAHYIKEHFDSQDIRLAYEAGFCGFWIQRELSKEGIKAIVVNAADVPLSDKDRKFKNDVRDSHSLADGLKTPKMKAIYVPSIEEEENQAIIRLRNDMVEKRTKIVLQIKSIIKKFGIKMGSGEDRRGRQGASFNTAVRSAFEKQKPRLLAVIETMIKEYEFYDEQIKKAQAQINEILKSQKYSEDFRIVKMVSGIGEIVGENLLLQLYNIERFQNVRRFTSFMGFIPTEHSSGPKVRLGRMSKRVNTELRKLIIESAWVAVQKDPAFTKYYDSLIDRGVKPQKAIIKCAKKLCSRIYHVLKYKEPYQVNYIG